MSWITPKQIFKMPSNQLPKGLYGITPEWSDTEKLCQAIKQAHAGGMAALQWRRKTGSIKEHKQQAQQISELCKNLGLVFIINDNWQLALELNADGVHMGKDDGQIAPARQALGPNKIIGRSCYNRIDLAAQAITDGVNYIAFGAVYPSTIKPNAPHANLELIHEGIDLVTAATTRPTIVTIGGINLNNAAPLVAAGVDNIAVISALFDTPDIQATAKRFADLFK